jgi:MFS family permease
MNGSYNYRRVFAAACLGMLLFGIVLISLGSVLPSVITQYKLDILQAGSLASLLPFGILAGSLAFGPVADRYSYRIMLVTCTILIITGLEGIAFATGLHMLQASFFLIGAGGGAMNGGTSALMADISSDRPGRRSANLSLQGVFFGIGALGVPALLALLSARTDYIHMLKYAGVIFVLPLMYFALIGFPAPKQPQNIPLRQSLALLRDASLVMFGLFLFFESATEGIVNNWTTTFLQAEKSFAAADSLLALSIFVLSMTLTRLLLAALLRKIPAHGILIVSVLIICSGILLIMLTEAPVYATAGLVLLGIGTAAGFPVMLGYVGSLYSGMSGTAFSLVFSIALIGNITVNYLMGVISRYYGLQSYPLVLLACAGFLVVTLVAVFKKNGKKIHSV